MKHALLPLLFAWAALAPDLSLADETSPPPEFDADGVQMLFPSAPGGASLALGRRDLPRTGFSFDGGMTATPGEMGTLRFWTTPFYPLHYSSGGDGTTSRLNLRPHRQPQRYTWLTQAGYLSEPTDLKNQEFTIYLRVHELLDANRAHATFKIRGGAHTSRDPDAASNVMLTVAPREARARTRFAKELTHPFYDYVVLTPLFDAALIDGSWIGIKMVSWNAGGEPASVVNRLYLDTDPFDAEGRPVNNWRLFSEYTDVDGHSTGRYDRVVDWGGWQTTMRVDGYSSLDFAYPSVREIVPPPAP